MHSNDVVKGTIDKSALVREVELLWMALDEERLVG